MLKGLLGCALACSAPTLVFAGERDRPLVPDARALLVHDTGTRMVAPGRRTPAPKPAAYVRLDYDGLEPDRQRADVALPSDRAPVASRFAIADLRTLPAWRLTAAPAQVTSTRGGDWAVRDTLNDYRKPRHRGSALGTMLVLRLDGQDETSSFSVGGGGVAAALWKVSR